MPSQCSLRKQMREVDSASKQAYKPDSVPLTGWRSSIWDARYRAPHAAYPEVKGNEQLPVPEGTPSCLALLPVGVAWPALSPAPPVVSYTTFSPLPELLRRYVSVALSVGLPRLAVSQHRALRSPDFPHPDNTRGATAQPAWTPLSS